MSACRAPKFPCVLIFNLVAASGARRPWVCFCWALRELRLTEDGRACSQDRVSSRLHGDDCEFFKLLLLRIV
jgi:hypothetical protein